MDYLDACLYLSEDPSFEHDVDLFHTVAIVKIPDHLSFSFEEKDVDIQFAEDLDYLNSRKLPRGTSLGRTRPGIGVGLEVSGEKGKSV